MKRVAVLGAGSWGTALAIVLSDNEYQVSLWGKREEQCAEINEFHTNEKYLPGIQLSPQIVATTSIEQALNDVDTIILAVPTKAMREIVSTIRNTLSANKILVHVSKGIEPETLLRISEMIEEELSDTKIKGLAVLSGPSHAEEVSKRLPTTVTVSSKNIEIAEYIQDMFINKHFRVYTNSDIIGVELGGALKNIIALGAGICDGLEFGDNAKAALITRGLAEIARLGARMGANPLTFSGLTGVGDLIVTCTSVHSRNWKAGYMLGKGKPLDEVLVSMGMVVEGVRTTKAAYQLSIKENVEMPITEAIYNLLFNNQTAKEVVEGLMGRLRTHEMEDLANFS